MRRLLVLLPTAALAASLSACGGSAVFDIPVGSCMDAASLEGDQVSRIETIDCAEEHDVEAYASTELTGATYPGKDAIHAEADEFCLGEFEPFVGTPYQESDLSFSFLYPTEESWTSSEDREILCLVIAPEPVTGSLRGAAR